MGRNDLAIPDFQSLMLPLMQLIADGQPHEMRSATEALGQQFQLTPAEWQEMLPSGRAPLFYNRLAWAKTHLKKAGLIEQPRRGVIAISARGMQVLASNPSRIDSRFLQTFPEYRLPPSGSFPESISIAQTPASELSAEETLESAFLVLRSELANDVLLYVKQCSPHFFEELVVKLLLRMGYGGSREEAGRAMGRTGDGGIDGIINEDRLGLDAIYLQAKRWEGSVGAGEIRDFKGALDAKGAQKGVFITTGTFTAAAREAASVSRSYKIVLIDGTRLADLMIEHDLGVSVAATYHLKRIDSDFFADE
jgi:restriction system protein